jgi:hypothetical protein
MSQGLYSQHLKLCQNTLVVDCMPVNQDLHEKKKCRDPLPMSGFATGVGPPSDARTTNRPF